VGGVCSLFSKGSFLVLQFSSLPKTNIPVPCRIRGLPVSREHICGYATGNSHFFKALVSNKLRKIAAETGTFYNFYC